MNPVLEAAQLVIDEVTARLKRGEKIPVKIKDELATLFAEVTRLIEEKQPAPEIKREEATAQLVEEGPKAKSDAASLLWIQAGGNPEIFTRYLETVPDPALKSLLKNPQELVRTIRELQSSAPPLAEPVSLGKEQVEPAGLWSSNIYGFQYNPKSQKLMVKFQGNKGYGQGPMYEYDGVPEILADLFASGAHSAKTSGKNKWSSWWVGKNPSLGSAMHHFIKLGGFPYRKVG